MPLWHVYHPEGAYDVEAKAALSKSITEIYTGVGLPAFYVAVYFHPLAGDNIWVGGVPQTELKRPFVRLVGENIAVNMGPDLAWKAEFMERVLEYLRPHTEGKGFDWEFHIDETPTELWRIQGLIAPALGTKPFEHWVKENRAVPWKNEEETA